MIRSVSQKKRNGNSSHDDGTGSVLGGREGMRSTGALGRGGEEMVSLRTVRKSKSHSSLFLGYLISEGE